MSIDKQRIYYNALFGALGGLISRLLIGLLLNFDTSRLHLLFLRDALLGTMVGVCIGEAIGVVDGLTPPCPTATGGRRWVVHDRESTQGTFVRYSGDPAQERQVSVNALKDGSTVRFGQAAFVFRMG